MQDNRRTAPRYTWICMRSSMNVVCVRRVRAYNLTCMLLIIYCSLSKDFCRQAGELHLHLQSTTQHRCITDAPEKQRYRYITECIQKRILCQIWLPNGLRAHSNDMQQCELCSDTHRGNFDERGGKEWTGKHMHTCSACSACRETSTRSVPTSKCAPKT